MDASYQRRGRLWSAADKAYLIDSILNGFDVPKLYLADFTYADSKLNKKRLPYAVIDGKQRLEAIFDFFEGTVQLNSDFVFLENPALKLGGLSYRDLSQNHGEIAEAFDNYNLSIMSVITNKEELINELFVRLNRSKPLTGAEVRNAMAGPAPEVIRQISKHDFFSECVSFQVLRGQDLNAAAKIILFEYFGEPQETKKASLDAFVLAASKDRNRLELAGRRTYSTLDDLTGVFLPKDRLLLSAGVVPVYYWFIRSIKQRQYRIVREFLVQFEEERWENRQKAETAGSRGIDKQLLEYDRLNRSTNDLTSHIERVRILAERFSRFAS
ncbi:hypothetical protein FRZ44_22740 [Hypericibacter terrae]|uniref:GmrSD restriction endonucleases N-terminal domain-containing protein n=2 Tax=Hypericibacter terrae TaxID=2602015 RepID=A0A5J6MHI2_9PROT|nr:hypothetical protein FRZ44_22740 [Hypericibacter terrae]